MSEIYLKCMNNKWWRKKGTDCKTCNVRDGCVVAAYIFASTAVIKTVEKYYSIMMFDLMDWFSVLT